MATIMPPQLPFEVASLILLPYFVAIIAVIIHTNKQIKKTRNRDSEKNKDDQHESKNENDNG